MQEITNIGGGFCGTNGKREDAKTQKNGEISSYPCYPGFKFVFTSAGAQWSLGIFQNTTGQGGTPPPPTTLPVITVGITGSITAGGPIHFTATQTSTAAGLTVRIQYTTTPTIEGSWTDLPDGHNGDLSLNGGVYNFGAGGTVFYPPGANIYFRAILAAPGYTDSISTNLGPYTLKQASLYIGVTLTSGSDPTGALRICHVGENLVYTFGWTNNGNLAAHKLVATFPYVGKFTPNASTVNIVPATQEVPNTTITTIAGAQFVTLGEMAVIPLGQYEPGVGAVMVSGPAGAFGDLSLDTVISDSGNGTLIVAGRARDIHLLGLPVVTNLDAKTALSQLTKIVGNHGGNIFNGPEGNLLGADGETILDNDTGAAAGTVKKLLAAGAQSVVASGTASLPALGTAGPALVGSGVAAVQNGGYVLTAHGGVISNDGGSIVSHDGGSLIAQDGSSLVGQATTSLISASSSAAVSQSQGGSIVSAGAGN